MLDILKEYLSEGRREPFANMKGLQNFIRDKWQACCRRPESEKLYCSGKGVSSSTKVLAHYIRAFLLVLFDNSAAYNVCDVRDVFFPPPGKLI